MSDIRREGTLEGSDPGKGVGLRSRDCSWGHTQAPAPSNSTSRASVVLPEE